MNTIRKKEEEKYQNGIEKKIEKEISRIQKRHNSELKMMKRRLENHKYQLLREKRNIINNIELKYRNKERSLERLQKLEREPFERKITNRGTKFISRSMPKIF